MYDPALICTVTRREPKDNPATEDHTLWDDYIVTLASGEVVVLPWGSDRYMALAAVLDDEPFTYSPKKSQ